MSHLVYLTVAGKNTLVLSNTSTHHLCCRTIYRDTGGARHLPRGGLHHEPDLPGQGQPRASSIHILVPQPAGKQVVRTIVSNDPVSPAHLLLIRQRRHQSSHREGRHYGIIPAGATSPPDRLWVLCLPRICGYHFTSYGSCDPK